MSEPCKGDKIDEYTIEKILGDGGTSIVFLARNDGGEEFAIKAYINDQVSLSKRLSIAKNQIEIMEKLKNEHLVRLEGIRRQAKYEGKKISKTCLAIVLQYVAGGCLFDFIEIEPFEEKVTRAYFKDFITIIYTIHSEGEYVHADLKPENILLTKDQFLLKITDFGNSFRLGEVQRPQFFSKQYTPPEILDGSYKQVPNYSGVKIDIYAAGLILLCMHISGMPYGDEAYFEIMKQKRYDQFWNNCTRISQRTNLTQAFKDLVIKMIATDPKQRIDLQQIPKHPWFDEKLKYSSPAEIREEFHKRKQKIIEKEKQYAEENLKKKQNLYEILYKPEESRGDKQYDEELEQYFIQEDKRKRTLRKLESFRIDDIVINEQSVYAISVLMKFLNKEIVYKDDPIQRILLIPSIEQVNEDEFNVHYNCEIQNEKVIDHLKINIILGMNETGNVVISLKKEHGFKMLYFRKVVTSIKNLFAGVLV